MQPLVRLEQVLRANNQSVTAVRQTVFAALQGQEPLTMRDLAQRCPHVDRASVYRTVALFEGLGIVQRLQTGWKYRLELSDEFHDHHHHATCLRCGQLTILPEDRELEKHLHRLAALHQFVLQSHQVELSGLCRDCQQR